MIISTLFYEVPKDTESAITEDVQTRPLIAYEASSGTLLHVDYNEAADDEDVELHMRLLWKYIHFSYYLRALVLILLDSDIRKCG